MVPASAKRVAVIQGGLIVREVHHSLEVLDDNSTTFRSDHSFTVEAEIPSRFFVRSYRWTGTDETDTPELDSAYDIWGHPVQRLHGPVIREGQTRIVLVDLGRTLQVGEIERIRIRHSLRDFGKSFQPRLGRQARPGLQQLTLTVTLPAPLADNVIYQESEVDSRKVLETEILTGEATSDAKLRFHKSIVAPAPDDRAWVICWGRLATEAKHQRSVHDYVHSINIKA